MGIKIATVTVFYNSLKGLQKLIPTINGNFKASVFIDGVYKNWPMSDEERRGTGLSTDGSREFLQRYMESGEHDHSFYLLNAPFKTEYEKRMMYLDPELLLRTLDVDAILIMDSDEYVDEKSTSWELFYDNLEHVVTKTHHGKWNVYGIMVSEKVENRPYDSYQAYPSLWYKPWNMIYKPQSHYQFINYRWELQRHFNDNYSQYPVITIDGLKLYHDHNVRTNDDLKKKDEYQAWLRQHEYELTKKI